MADGTKTNTLAILGLIFAFIMPIVGLILSIIALVQIKKDPTQGGKGLAIAGLVVSLLLFFLFFVIMIITGLAYFGMMNPNKMLARRCSLPVGLTCSDFTATKTDGERIMLHIINGEGTGIVITGATATPSQDSVIKNACTATFTGTFNGASNILHLQNGEAGDITLICPTGTFSRTKADTMYRWDLQLTQYNDDSSAEYSRPLAGDLWSRIG